MTKTEKRICHKDRSLDHREAAAVHSQLVHPEICDTCTIKPCVFAEYMYGKLMRVVSSDDNILR